MNNIRPEHYKKGGFETITIIDDVLGHMPIKPQEGFALGNVLKYLCRFAHKGDELNDLMKAQWYLEHLIDIVKACDE